MRKYAIHALALAVLCSWTCPWASAAVLGNHQKITRVLPGQPFGNGTADLLISTSTTYSTTTISCSGTSSAGNKSLTIASAGFANGDIVLIHQSRGTGVGLWEVNQIASGGGTTTLTLVENKQNTYTDDGGSSQAQVLRIPMYNNVTINSGITWTAPTWNGNVGGILVVAAQGTVTITGTIDANTKGYVGGAAVSGNTAGRRGEGTAAAAGTQSTSANQTAAGGGAAGSSGTRSAGGGGGGGHATAGTNGNNNNANNSAGGTGGAAGGSADATVLIFGGGGGGGGSTNDGGSSGAGGTSGGIVMIFGKTINVGASALIRANGSNGGNASGSANGGGGGGSGGAVLLVGQDMALGTSRVTVANGTGGARTTDAGAGREGAVGRIAVHRSGTVSGTTSPAFNNQLDSSLVPNAFPNAPVNPLVEGQSNPLAITTTTPTFSWTFSDPDVGNTQSAYQILIGTDSADGSAWDSGKVTSSSTNVICGTTLDWHAIYHWKVRVWDQSDFVSAYCDEQSFSINSVPTDPGNPSPANDAYINTSTPLLSWSASTDEDPQDTISHFLTVADNQGLSNPVVANLNLAGATQYHCPALSDGYYFWQVRAFDGHQYNLYSPVWTFTVDTQPPAALTLSDVFCSLTGDGFSQILGTGEIDTTLTLFDIGGTIRPGSTTWNGQGNFVFTPSPALPWDSALYLRSMDLAGNQTFSRVFNLAFRADYDVFRDDSVYYGPSPGSSLRLRGETAHEFSIAVNADQPVTVTARVRKNSSYTGAAPRLQLNGLGLNGTGAAAATMTGGPNEWEQLTVTGTPSAQGILTLRFETFSTASGADAWIDAISVTQ